MKKQGLLALLGCGMLFAAMQIALAGDIPANPTQMSSILQNLQDKGFNIIKKIEFEHGQYEAQAVNLQGKLVKLHINAQTGEITDAPAVAQKNLSALDAVKKAEEAGYRNIYKFVANGTDEYEMKAFDKDGKKVKLEVDAISGKVSKKWFD